MSDFPDIINTQIITSAFDVFWADATEKMDELTPKPVLVISTPFDADSAEAIQLKKMLQACQLDERMYHVVQLKEDAALAWHILRDKLQVKTIILLGINPEQLGVSVQFMPHQVSRFNDTAWILTGPLQQLIQHTDIKNHLWNYGLKPVFIDKVYG